jgi:predicted ABC-class ATPase
MKTLDDLRNTLQRIDGRGYKAYKDIQGSYSFGDYTVIIDYVQGDPFASPSRARVVLDQKKAGFPDDTYSSRSREIGLRDYLTRGFTNACTRIVNGRRGIGKSGMIAMDRPGQEVLERTSIFVNADHVEARFVVGLPAFGRRIAGRHAIDMFFEELPRIVDSSLLFTNVDARRLYEHIETIEDADFLRGRLEEMGLVAFVADWSILPRISGIDSRPLKGNHVVSFQSPGSMRTGVNLPNRGKISGMGIPKGVTLIVGGGYHGKSTLLSALELGVYNHIPGDGRELVVTDPTTVKIRAEDGRRIEKVDISPFISNLPFGKGTKDFCSEDASGSTSQAANIIEAIEVGTRVLLIDEDTSATNFMIRDHRMQELVAKDREPITPYLDKVRQLSEQHDISTILVIGGSGDYFDVADHVICMVDYIPRDKTERAREIADKFRAERSPEGGKDFGETRSRIPVASSFDASKGRRDVKISSKGLHTIAFGTHTIELGAVEQLVDVSQTRAIGDALHYATRYMDGSRTVCDIVERIARDVDEKGLDELSPRPVGDYARFRPQEFASAMNRLRTLSVVQRTTGKESNEEEGSEMIREPAEKVEDGTGGGGKK